MKFTCFTSTTVQILTLLSLLVLYAEVYTRTQFTCFTSTRVRILTLTPPQYLTPPVIDALLHLLAGGRSTQFACFTGTKVQILYLTPPVFDAPLHLLAASSGAWNAGSKAETAASASASTSASASGAASRHAVRLLASLRMLTCSDVC